MSGVKKEAKQVKDSSRDALLGSLKETFIIGTKEFSKSVGSLLRDTDVEEGLDKNQISHRLDKREKALQNSRT